ncbi:MAG: DUF362 domain-containing protein [Deltaproteobacteria bacterium]|nr:DUF362 domain-containing protein [Deltaproteobacteria bacterium]MBW2120706.1 DUF362 domain-containing protein [Deltaproteobacteria bacterium]
MKSQVYFANLRIDSRSNVLDKLERLMSRAAPEKLVESGDLVAVKLHFGEPGNSSYVRPIFLRRILSHIQGLGGKPFLTDTNTLYRGERSESVSHLRAAVANGFGFSSVGAPLIIADGLMGNASVRVAINGNFFQEITVAHDIYYADCLVSVAHFTGHEFTGFGATIKNLGMGGVSREGKLSQHSNLGPKVNRKKCKACGICAEKCAFEAISMVRGKARVHLEKCKGCGICIVVCPQGAIAIQWNREVPLFQKKLVEHALGVLQNKKGKAFFFNFLLQVSPHCDCAGANDAPIVGDIGILASTDPVAIDQAAVDLVNAAQGNPGSKLTKNLNPGEDKLRGLYPEVDWEVQLEYGEQMGLGSRTYDLVPV